MPLIKTIDRVKLPVGRTESPQVVIPSGTKSIKLQLNAAVWNDEILRMTLQTERSLDGGNTWEHWVSAEIHGGARDKEGSLPSISINSEDDQGNSTILSPFPVRVIVIVNKQSTLGVDLTVL